jgi:hypothetical protein
MKLLNRCRCTVEERGFSPAYQRPVAGLQPRCLSVSSELGQDAQLLLKFAISALALVKLLDLP